MNQKAVAIGVAVFAAGVILGPLVMRSPSAQVQAGPATGRYQLVAASDGQSIAIDTATGDTWRTYPVRGWVSTGSLQAASK